jgi:hypothetical protein
LAVPTLGQPAAPPFALESTFRTSGAIESVELGHVLLGEGKVEDLGVLGQSLAVS